MKTVVGTSSKSCLSLSLQTQPVEEVENLRDLGNGSLRISSVTKDHEGSYHCFLALENGQLSQEFTLTVEEGGEEDRLLCGGGTCTARCWFPPSFFLLFFFRHFKECTGN